MSNLRIAGLVEESIVDGPGIRFVVFAQGCLNKCADCHNPDSHDPDGGHLTTTGQIIASIRGNPILMGLTLSGGEPFLQAQPLAELARDVRSGGLDVWTYTGFTFEDIISSHAEKPHWRELLEATDVLVDGPFDSRLRSMTLRFRGSANQRLIDVRKSLSAGHAVAFELEE